MSYSKLKGLPPYTAAPFFDEAGKLTDITVSINKRELRMLGSAGVKREKDLAEAYLKKLSPDMLPIILGSGLGFALEEILKSTTGPVAIVDKEDSILEHTKLDKTFSKNSRVTFINSTDPKEALNRLTYWQDQNSKLPFLPCLNPFYLRLGEEARDYYNTLNASLKASQKYNFWEKIKYPRFQEELPRILLITSHYFLIGEITEACEKMKIPFQLLQLNKDELAQEEFIQQLLKAAVEFKPDFIFTINHLGIDREGILMELLGQLELPLASWFVDNPHLIIYRYQGLASPWVTIFTWDADNIESLQADGFHQVIYLPLATTPDRFQKKPSFKVPKDWSSDISFVGNSMQYKVKARMEVAKPGPELLAGYKEVAAGFAQHDERSVLAYLETEYKDLLPAYKKLESLERKLAFETMITWEATRQYRESCVEQILPFNPLILGDKGWDTTFKNSSWPWRGHSEIGYYHELPFFYPKSKINFNCTSKQMKGAVNQRIFDVPMAGAFVLTDWREQMDHLFEPGKEIICYREPEEIPDLVRFYLNNPNAREKIVLAARKRIFSEHTYTLRLKELISHMQRIYG